jgi:hypothetical protein
MAAAPPYVSYSSCAITRIDAAEWQYVYSSLQALKAHVQEYPGCEGFDLFVRAEGDEVLVHCYTTWDLQEQLEAFLESGYTFERFLHDVNGVGPDLTLAMEKIF